MDIIKALRVIGISPKDLKGLFDQKDIKAFPHYLASQRAAAEQRIIELQETIRRIDAAQEYIQHSIATIKKRDIYERVIPDRHVITSEFEVIDGSLDPAEWLDRLLLSYSRLSHVMEENNLMDAYETGIIFLPDSSRLFRPAQIYSRVLVVESIGMKLMVMLIGKHDM